METELLVFERSVDLKMYKKKLAISTCNLEFESQIQTGRGREEALQIKEKIKREGKRKGRMALLI